MKENEEERAKDLQKLFEQLPKIIEEIVNLNSKENSFKKYELQKSELYGELEACLISFKNISDTEEFERKSEQHLKRLENIFIKGYERNYSDAYRILRSITNNSSQNSVYEELSTKLKILLDKCNEKILNLSTPDELQRYKDIRKLLDYFILECTRVKEYSSFALEKNQLSELIKKYEANEVDSKSYQERSITMFSIFSAVIITFSTGFSLSTDIIKGIVSTSAYRIVFLLSLLGFILFNTIFMLLFVVGRMTNRNIGLKCPYLSDSNCTCHEACNHPKAKRSASPYLCILFHKYPYILFVDILLVGLMLIVGIIWAVVQPSNLRTFIVSYWPILFLITIATAVAIILIYRLRYSRKKEHNN